jgi:hypothetical protein
MAKCKQCKKLKQKEYEKEKLFLRKDTIKIGRVQTCLSDRTVKNKIVIFADHKIRTVLVKSELDL